jgi:mediator of RNA polymerase II transcription subunit 10
MKPDGLEGPRMLSDYRQKINSHLITLNTLSLDMQSTHDGTTGDSVPRNVAENVDGYRNPHSYTKNTLSRAVGENQYALGRILGLEVC